MKTLLLLFALIPFYASAQCDLKTEEDKFTGIVTRKSKFEVLGRNFARGVFSYQMFQVIKEDTSMSMFLRFTPGVMTCFGGDCSIKFKSGDKILEVPVNDKVDCATGGNILISYADLSKSDMLFLKTHFIEAVRVHFTEGYADYDLSDNKCFMKTLKCFE